MIFCANGICVSSLLKSIPSPTESGYRIWQVVALMYVNQRLLGLSVLVFQELAGLEVGDIVRLDSEINSPLELVIHDQIRYLGQPGIRKHIMAAKILKVVDSE